MPGQAERFVEAVANRTDIDFLNDWKMVTIWIGGNNICAACNGGYVKKVCGIATTS